MPGNINYSEQKYMNNLSDYFSDNGYTPSIQTIEGQVDNRFMNQENNNLDFNIFRDHENNSINNNTDNDNTITATKTIKKLGRIRKEEIRQVFHNKYSDDNIIKKIKTFCMIYLDIKLNNSIIFTYKKFYKLNPDINENLKKDYNIKLMNMTIREIYEENAPSKKYDPSVIKKNYVLIQEIFNENENTQAIEILNTKFIDFLNELETKEYICKEIEKKAKKPNAKIDDIISYMSKVRKLLEHFEEWFTKKRKRNYKSKHKDNTDKNKIKLISNYFLNININY